MADRFDYDYQYTFEVVMPIQVISGSEKAVQKSVRDSLKRAGATKIKLLKVRKKGEP